MTSSRLFSQISELRPYLDWAHYDPKPIAICSTIMKSRSLSATPSTFLTAASASSCGLDTDAPAGERAADGAQDDGSARRWVRVIEQLTPTRDFVAPPDEAGLLVAPDHLDRRAWVETVWALALLDQVRSLEVQP